MGLDGEWYNQLKSKMVLKVAGADVTGEYHTEVGNADGIYPLAGRTEVGGGLPQNVGWVVSWQNDKRWTPSVTSWSGQLHDVDGEETIVTTWLLTRETKPKDDWQSTLVGQDVFRRASPGAAPRLETRSKRALAHPSES